MSASDNEPREIDAHSGQATTGHEWDGVKELDTPLPRWWLYIFYATIVAAVIYWVLMPAWPLVNGYTKGVLNYSDRRIVMENVGALETARAADYARLRDASFDDIIADQSLQEFALAAGEAAFGDNCATCHGAGGAGAPGYPSLADNVWIWGGTLADIEHTITVGVRSGHPQARFSQMPAFGRDGLLAPRQIADVTEYVLSLSEARRRAAPDAAAAARGAIVYAEQCAICHGANAAGDRAQGAPSLVDDIWLYGGSREEVRRQIETGRGGVMPNWDRRFDPGLIRALAVYVYAQGGGEPDAPAPASSATETPAGE
ncbi:MAG: cytochrome-c oxidase, cbb3-type subunit III [Hydrogenophilaceae bacterium]|jgi:cytochrome c oxidase cbb3-type subunit 3|nr:cytochrome-c oxidase, cbb3-type subunit III [Hydrogenophilaceae bacterium]